MAKIAGYNGEIQLSGDGGQIWQHLSFVTNGELSFDVTTSDESTWDDRGFSQEIPQTIKGTFKLEGIYDNEDAGQQLLEKHSLNKQKLRVTFWRDYRDQGKYYEFNAYVISLVTPQNTENRTSFQASLSVEGISLKTVK